ncbi:MAG: endonuclease domain-containing protein [Bacteroidetes bacterium]|nr:endonuclease domain-containing protein [Bacteroidota bacterium]
MTSPQPLSKGEGQENPGYITNSQKQWSTVSPFANKNRKDSTEAEDILWQAVRNRQIDGFKFRRQHPIEGYIPDFVCLEKRLVVEIDGGYHYEKDQKELDEARTLHLNSYGYTEIRFSNEEVINDIDGVVRRLGIALKETSPQGDLTLNPSPK